MSEQRINPQNLNSLDVLQYLKERAKDKPSVFVQLYCYLNGRPLRYVDSKDPFRWRHFLIGPLDCLERNEVEMKARQVGASSLHIGKSLFLLTKYEHTSLIYTFPRDKQLRKFSQTRVDKMIDESPYFSKLCPPKDRNVYLKPIGTSLWHLVSAWETGLGEGTPADFLFFDEYDRMRDEVETAFSESISSSRFGFISRFSTPTLPTRGVARLYALSTRHRYYYTCEHCGERQFLTIDENLLLVDERKYKPHLEIVEDGAFQIVCRKCKRELNRMQKGVWIPEYKDRDIVGFHISQLNCPWISADEIMRKKLKYRSEQLFRNYVLGEPYVDNNAGISRGVLLQCIDPSRKLQFGGRGGCEVISVGIDWGSTNWVVVLGMQSDGKIVLLNFFWVEDTDEPLGQVREIATRIAPYNPDYIVGDMGYGKDRNAQMLHYFPNKFFACQYLEGGFLMQWNEKRRIVKANRTLSLQNVMMSFVERRIILPQLDSSIETLITHITNLAVVKDEDEETGTIVERVEHLGPADGAHALNYALLPLEEIRFHTESTGEVEFDFVTDYLQEGPFPQPGTIRGFEDLDQYWKERTSTELDFEVL